MTITPPPGFEPFNVPGTFVAHNAMLYRKTDESGRTVWGFAAEAQHENPNGVIHGGMLMTFVDTIMGQTAEEMAVRYTATISLTCEFLASKKVPCWVEGHVRVSRLARTVAFVRAELTSGGDTLLTASGVWRVFDQESARVKAMHGSSP
jgi:acyl-coenzyme A thioesterase PaaI-like protein